MIFSLSRVFRTRSTTVLLMLLIGVGGCGDAAGSAAGATSSLCSGVRGAEAILWDLYNGVARTDSVLPPPVPTGGGSYTNPTFPLLGFVYPAGWMPQTTTVGINNVGVNLFRQDMQAIWREESLVINGTATARAVRDFEVNQLLEFLGQQGATPQTVCTNENSGDAGGGIIVSFSNVMIRTNTHTAVVSTSVTPFPGLPNASVRAKVVASPTAEFPGRALDTFLAIDWQMLLGENSNLFDRDGDGWRDGVDEFPNDPTRH